MRRRTAHLTRVLIEGISNYSPFKGGRLAYVREYDHNPMIAMDLTTKMDVEWAIKNLYERKQISQQELMMLRYVMMDGRLSRRDISHLIEKDQGYIIDQRTISRRLESAYLKISKFLGFEYGDGRIFRMVAKQRGYKYPYILTDEEIEEVVTIMERV